EFRGDASWRKVPRNLQRGSSFGIGPSGSIPPKNSRVSGDYTREQSRHGLRRRRIAAYSSSLCRLWSPSRRCRLQLGASNPAAQGVLAGERASPHFLVL